MLKKLIDPNRRVVMREGYPMHGNGTWRIVLDDAQTGEYVHSRLGFKSYNAAWEHAKSYFNVEG